MNSRETILDVDDFAMAEIDESLLAKYSIDEILYVKNLKQRKLYLDDDVCANTADPIVRTIMQYNRDDKDLPVEDRQPIMVYITSRGGEVDAGFSVIDAIKMSKTPVYTINLGYEYSMAFLIGIAGAKRFSTKNAKFLMHDGTNFAWDSGNKVKDKLEFDLAFEDKIKEYVTSNTKISDDVYESKKRVEWYMLADEAKRMGVIDYIIGEDCDIDEIV